MIRYALIGVIGAILALSGYALHLQRANAKLSAENGRLSASLATCNARTGNILEDKESDASTGDPNFVIPDHWLRTAK